MASRKSRAYALWDVLKFDGDYYFATYDPDDDRNDTILKPRGGPPPPSIEGYKMYSIMKFIPSHIMVEMVHEFLLIFGHLGHEPCEGPQPCSMRDYKDIKDRASYYDVD